MADTPESSKFPRFNRRSFLVASSTALAGAGLAACSSDEDGSATPGLNESTDASLEPGAAGLIGEESFQARADAYLAHATAGDSLTAVVIGAHLARAQRDPDYAWDVDSVTPETFAEVFEKIDAWEDTRDFDLMYLFWLGALGSGDSKYTQLAPEVFDAIDRRFVANRYRYDDPLPGDRVDNLWFWSENHVLINLTLEYLVGTRLADETFTVANITGAEHAARARDEILQWIRERLELGFFEWHSHVYMLKNITPLTMLAELADDPEIVDAATVGLDLCFLDMAAHTHKGCYTAPRGRTYKKDKTSSLDEDTWDSAKLIFDDTTADYETGADGGATYLAAAQRYRAPQLVVDIATADGPSVVKERHGVYFDYHQPLTDKPEAPLGKDFDDPGNLTFWWSLGAVGMWPLARTGVAAANEFRLWEADGFEDVALIASLNDNDPEKLRGWLHQRSEAVNFGFLSEANTYAYRDDLVSMASVLDHRFGEMRDQVHAWQAAIDETAMVFTTHPVSDREESTEWRDDGRPGYWTGEASMPRSAQHERSAVHIYLPAWSEETHPLIFAVYPYRPFTHAYVPQDEFDSVVQGDKWTVASKAGAHIALWSWRATTWREYDPSTYATRGMTKPFDLVAEGGPDNVWISELGSVNEHGSAEDFLDALTSAVPEVERGDSGFAVKWTSPTAGAAEFSSSGAFRIEGEEQPLDGFARHESPWGLVGGGDSQASLAIGDRTWAVDVNEWTRTVS